MELVVAGIDLAAEARNTGLAVLRDVVSSARPGEPGRAGVVVERLVVDVVDQAIEECVAEVTITGVDVPFGWPVSFSRLIAEQAVGELDAPPSTGIDWRRNLALRATDRHVHQRTGMVPLSVSTDKIALPAMRWAGIEARLRDSGLGTARDGSERVCEVYPAGALRHWSLPHRGYKGVANTAVRAALVESLASLLPWLDWNGYDSTCRADDNALDALVAALVAREVAAGRAEPPPAEHRELALQEGWIWLPSGPPTAPADVSVAQPCGRPRQEWVAQFPLLTDLIALRETAWFPDLAAVPSVDQPRADGIDEAAARLDRFAPVLERLFPELESSRGVIESPLQELPAAQARLQSYVGVDLPGRLWGKLDSHLPVSGSIKARGGVHEVLAHAERLALDHGLVAPGEDYSVLAEPPARELFGAHALAVGSTGNLGLAVGIMGAALGLRTLVHMSADAREWKKDLLRSRGVIVREYEGDFTAAVAAGRAEAAADPLTHFVDDENSTDLFYGYAVAARCLERQLQDAGVTVDAEHPLFVYLPCGVGGGPGGVAFGLHTVFGDAVHPVFAEPTHCPSMLLGVHTGLHDAVSVQDFGIDGRTAADGLAVGRPSGFVGRAVQHIVEGYVTVSDERLFAMAALLHESEGIDVEPSAVAGLPGPWRLLDDGDYRERTGLTEARCRRATHVVWLTGGAMVPLQEMAAYLARGRELLHQPEAAPSGLELPFGR